MQVAKLTVLLFVDGHLTFSLLLLVEQFDMKVTHLSTVMIDCHLNVVHITPQLVVVTLYRGYM